MNRNLFIWKSAYLIAAAALVLLDQRTKAWAKETLQHALQPNVVIAGFLNFDYAENTGVAFSQLQGGGDTGRWALAALAMVAAVAVLFFFWKMKRADDRIMGACVLLLAGIVGNLIDRVRLGYVIDFIDVQFGSWHYPTFNIADAAICLGAGLLLLDLFLNRKKADDTGDKKAKA